MENASNIFKQIFSKNTISKYELGEILTWRCWDKNRENIEKYLDEKVFEYIKENIGNK